MTKGEKRAAAAIAEYRAALEDLGERAPMMKYESGWVRVSCSSERMQFPRNERVSEIERLARVARLQKRFRP